MGSFSLGKESVSGLTVTLITKGETMTSFLIGNKSDSLLICGEIQPVSPLVTRVSIGSSVTGVWSVPSSLTAKFVVPFSGSSLLSLPCFDIARKYCMLVTVFMLFRCVGWLAT